jgi:predicted nicotinamide N-methyase
MGGVTDRAAARAAKSVLAAQLATVPGVVGIGLARRSADYVVKVDLADPDVAQRVPGNVDGVPVVTEVVGAVRPL